MSARRGPSQNQTWAQPELGTDPGAAVVRDAGAGELSSVVVGAFGSFEMRSRITGVKGSTSPPAKPFSPRSSTSDSCNPPPTYRSRSIPYRVERKAGAGPAYVPRRRSYISHADGTPIPRT